MKKQCEPLVPFELILGYGTAHYKMGNGGVFKHKDKVLWQEQAKIKKIVQEESRLKITYLLQSKNIELTAYMDEQENRTRISFVNKPEEINRMWFNLKALPKEHVYGCGECFTDFDLRGKKVRIWVAEHQNLQRIIKKFLGRQILKRKDSHISKFEKYDSYYVQPTFVSSEKYYVHIDTSYYSEFDFRQSDYHSLMIRGIPQEIIIGKEKTFEHLMSNLTALLGRQPELPEWVYNGAILGVQGGTNQMLSQISKIIEKGAKLSGVWCQDWEGVRITAFGKQLMWNWAYDKDLYPSLDRTIIDLEKKGIKFLGYINPFLAVEGSLYQEATKKGYLVKNKKNEDYMVTITTFPAAMIDLTNPYAVEWLKDIIKKNMIEIGLGGWMADFGEYMPTDAILYSGISGEVIHNAWPSLWAKVNREAIEEAGKLGEVFFFTRAGYTETIRYSTMMWNGDQHVDFSLDDGLPSVIPGSLSLSMSGFGLVHSDIGGYTTLFDMKRSKDLFIRWLEMNTFSPIMRNHEGNRPDSNVQIDYDEEVLKVYAKMSNVYYKLKRYVKEVVSENTHRGIPVMRPLFMYYEEERAYKEQYEYLLGKDILVAPVLEKDKKIRSVYLPSDNWVHIWSGKIYTGGIYEIQAPYGCPPVFYRQLSNYHQLFEQLNERTLNTPF